MRLGGALPGKPADEAAGADLQKLLQMLTADKRISQVQLALVTPDTQPH